MKNSPTLKRSLGLWPIVMLGLGYLTPAVVFDTFGLVSKETSGHVPTAYLLTLVAMLFTAFSYGKMVNAYPTAGSAYTYAQRSINPKVGFLVGWLALLDYLLLPMINILLGQQYLSAIFPSVPGWLWVVVLTGAMTYINIKSIKSTANINSIFVVYQFLIVVAFIVLGVKQLLGGMGYGSPIAMGPLFSSNMHFSPLVSGATILCFSFLGFDAVSTYTEEAINPKKTIPRAIFLTALIGGGIFIIASYVSQLLFPDISLFKDIENTTAPDISFYVGGKIFQTLFLSASFAGIIASALASHASVSRLLYVMGRDNVLPNKFFGYVHPKFQTPVYNILFVGAVCLTAVFFSMQYATSFINFGSLIAFTFVNLSVIAQFAIREKKYKSLKQIITNIIIPSIGALFVGVLWANVQRDSFILGVGWAIIGIIYLFFLIKVLNVRIDHIGEEKVIDEKITINS